ncbi:MAG: hypothetical protein AAFZ15_30630 [Bacteroidota bacterium]
MQKTVAFFFLFMVPVLILGQDIRDSLFVEVRSKLEPLINDLGKTSLEKEEEYNLYVVDAIMNLKDAELEPINRDRYYDLKIKQLEQDWGLNLRAQVNNNFDNYFFNQDEFDDQLTPLRVRAGLDWEIMRNGLLAHQNKIQQLKNEKQIDWITYDKQKNTERYFYRYNILIYYFNVEKIKLLRERKKLLEEQLQLLYRIYYIRDIMFEEIIAMKGQLEQLEVQLNNYLEYNALMESIIGINQFPTDIDVMKLPVVDLNINDLLKDSAHVLNLDWTDALERENDRLKNAPVNDISLRVQLFQNLGFADPNSPRQTYTSGGLVASVPLEFLYRGDINEQIADENASIRKQQSKYSNLNTATEITNYYYEFNYKMKQYVEFLYKYMLYEEKLRVEQVDKVHFTDYYQPFRILKYYDQLQLVKLELIDLKQQLYLFLLKIYSKTNLKSLKDYLRPIASNDYYAKLPASRTIFMKEADFKKYDAHFIENYLRFNDFNYAILEEELIDIHDEPLNKDLADLAQFKYVQFIKTHTWNTSYENLPVYAEFIKEEMLEKGYNGLMIRIHEEDVKGKSKNDLADLVQDIQTFFIELQNIDPEVTFFLNLPVDFPLEEASKLSGWVEKMVLRLENESDLESVKTIPDRILPFEYLPICVSLDVGRFVDRLKLEAYINQIIQDKRINDIVFNDFQAFISMETKMFSEKIYD